MASGSNTVLSETVVADPAAPTVNTLAEDSALVDFAIQIAKEHNAAYEYYALPGGLNTEARRNKLMGSVFLDLHQYTKSVTGHRNEDIMEALHLVWSNQVEDMDSAALAVSRDVNNRRAIYRLQTSVASRNAARVNDNVTLASNDTVNTANSAAPTNTNTTPASNPVEDDNNSRNNRNNGNNNGNVHNNNNNGNNRNANRNSYRGRGNGRGGPRGGLRIGSNYHTNPNRCN